MRIERLTDVVVCAQAERFLRGLERAKAGEHDHGDVRIDLANETETIDAVGSGHADIGDDRIGMLLAKKTQSIFHRVGQMYLIVWLQEHAETFARPHLIIDNEDLRKFRAGGHRRKQSQRKLRPCRGRMESFDRHALRIKSAAALAAKKQPPLEDATCESETICAIYIKFTNA